MLFKINDGLNTNSAIARVNVAIAKLCTFVNEAAATAGPCSWSAGAASK